MRAEKDGWVADRIAAALVEQSYGDADLASQIAGIRTTVGPLPAARHQSEKVPATPPVAHPSDF